MRQELRLEQKQIITPQLLLNLKLLALPNLELETLIRNEIQQNPVLEIITEESEQTVKEETELPLTQEESEPETNENKDEFDIAELISDDSYALPTDSSDKIDISETIDRTKTSFEDTLLPIVKDLISEKDYEIAEYIIGNITDDGFLLVPNEEVIKTLSISPEHLNEILNIVQHIEPGGIASRNLAEALICQLEILGFDNNSKEVKIIREHFELLLKRNYAKIAHLLDISENEISTVLSNLHSLETRPARRYLNIATDYISPDFSIEWYDNKLIGNINDETFPVLKIAARYREIIIHPKNFTPDEVEFARNKVQNALNLIKGIEARKRLLHRIVDYIILTQQDFFVKGKEFIKPISIKQTAEALGVHISTLSRACQGKYIETPVGIFSMKYCFTTGIGDLSRHSIKEKIRDLISKEDKTKPYTDDDIVNLLAQENVHLSRRTVAKYREELNISGSSERIEKR
jgi:RNA polymerase sigma-54 factor